MCYDHIVECPYLWEMHSEALGMEPVIYSQMAQENKVPYTVLAAFVSLG